MQQISKQPAFELGQIVATPGALAALKKAGHGQPNPMCPVRCLPTTDNCACHGRSTAAKSTRSRFGAQRRQEPTPSPNQSRIK